MQKGLGKVARRFRRDEGGGTTIEFILWVPILVGLLILVAQASVLLTTRANVLRAMQDGNRAMAVGLLRTADATELFVLERIAQAAPHATVTATVAAGTISTVVVIPARDVVGLLSYPFFSFTDSLTMTIASSHLLEA